MDKINQDKKKETELATFNKIKKWPCQDLNDYKLDVSKSVIEQVKRVSEAYRSIDYLRPDWFNILYTDTDSYRKLLDNERNILESAEKVVKSEQNKNEYEKNIQGLKEGCLKKYLLTRLPKNSQEKVKDEKFLDIFKMDASQEAVVVSIDIRDSTQLMLNAKKPELFAEFIRDVTAKIFEIIKENYGISDKFTGDGLLCFFPKEYSGDDAIYYALKASAAAHKLFEREYKKHYDKFSVVKADVGLGIGIDSGEVYFTPICQEPTIVGIPGRTLKSIKEQSKNTHDLEHGKIPDPITDILNTIIRRQEELEEIVYHENRSAEDREIMYKELKELTKKYDEDE